MSNASNLPEQRGGMLEAALFYAKRGFPVFPCRPDKSPRTSNGFYAAATDEHQVREWWSAHPDDLIGLRTGEPSGIFVLDVDNGEVGRASLERLEAEHGRLPDTYTVRTSGNPEKGKGPGEHRYFRYPGGVGKIKSTTSQVGNNLDVRGDGGYVIAPPSYGYAKDSGEFGEFAEAPGWLVEMVRGEGSGRSHEIGESIPDGRRNATLTSLAGSMRLRGASTMAILAALNEENNTKCRPPLPWREVAAIAKSVGRYAPGSLPRTDTGNAERLVGRHGHDLTYVYGLGWFVWSGTHWRRDRTGEVERRAKETVRSIHEEAARVADDDRRKQLAKWAIASESAARIRAMISLAMSEPGVPVGEVEELDKDPWLLNVTNGTLDLRTGELREHRREDLITKLAPVEYDPDAEAPAWEAFLRTALPSESVRGFVQRAVGYSLTGVVGEKVLPFLYGPGDTGKTTFVETVMNLLGDDYAQPAAPDLLLSKRGGNHPTELADLLGKRFVAAVEVEQGRRLAESLVKQLTGGDRIKARFMREDFFDFKPTHKVWFAANHRPDVRETGNAIWNRIKLVPFDVVIPKERQDRRLTEKLRDEAPGILAWAMRGCLGWQEEGLGEPEEVMAATAEYREEMDPLADFFSERCVLGPEVWASKKDLQKAYKGWADWVGQKPLDWNFVADRLKELGCTKKRKHTGHGWTGIGLRSVEPPGGDVFDVTGR